MAGAKISGIALGALGAGSVFLYAGIKGKSILAAFQLIVQGKDPRTAKGANPITGTPATAGAGGTVNTTPIAEPTSASEKAWIAALLLSIAAPPTTANVNSIAGWIQHESSWNASPPDGAEYTHNPLNTTEPGFGATTSVNSVGVKIYPTAAQGLAATVAALENGDYSDILTALRSGKGLTGSYTGLSTWSGGGYSSI
jgi:hypothetical protein